MAEVKRVVKKIGEIADVVMGKEVEFTIRRTEGVDNEDDFESLHKEFGVDFKATHVSCKSSGKLKMDDFLDFLSRYDEDFDLSPTVVELGPVVINPVLI